MEVPSKLVVLVYVFFSHVAVAMRVQSEHALQQEAAGRDQDLGGLAAKIACDPNVEEDDPEEYMKLLSRGCSPAKCTKPHEVFSPNYSWSDECFLGNGCSGRVWRGRCAGKQVVVKAQRRGSYVTPCEAHVMEKDLSSGFVRAFATSADEDCSYTVMEYANAGTLADYLPKRARRSDSELGRIFYESLLALQQLHNLGLVHRDLKPDNIFINSAADELGYLHPKIGDLGFACYYTEKNLEEGSPCRRCDDSAGSPMYMSPTYVKTYGDYSVDVFPADDLWSMGQVLLQMVHRSTEWVKTDLEEQEALKFEERNETLDVFKMREALVGVNLVSEKMKNSAPLLGKPALQKLLEFLLCSGCNDPVGTGPEATEKAIALTKTWLEEEFSLTQDRLDEIRLHSAAEVPPECLASPFLTTELDEYY